MRFVLLIALMATTASAEPVEPVELQSDISAKMNDVEEFRFMKALAAKMKVKVFLFGGTAAGFGHYVRWDLA